MYGNIVLASAKGGFVPNAIKWFTKSEFSHSLVTMPDTLGIPMCMEASEGGVDMLRFDSNYISNPAQGYEVWNLKLPQEVKDKALRSIINELETRYGFLAYPWFIWRKLNLMFGRDIRSHNNWNTGGMICSQLCVAYLKACGLSCVFAGYGDDSVAPQDLQDIFRAHPELFERVEVVRLTQ